jgi:AraC-like DNA-binding protein
MIADVDRKVEEVPSGLAAPRDTRAARREARLARQHDIRGVALVSESIGEGERRASYRVGDSWSRSSTFDLRSGMRLSVNTCRFEPGFSFPVVQPAAELELVVSKGGAVQVRAPDGRVVRRGGNTLELGRTRDPVQLHVHPDGEVAMESLTISVGEQRLRELLGAQQLPRAFRGVTESEDPYPLASHTTTPRLLRLLDEIVNADVKGASRLLWHEAKSLELIAVMTDELVEADSAQTPVLSPTDIDRLERVRRLLVERLEEPPTLAELARTAGCNVTKLKGGFRTLFGTSVFAYLRRIRMEQARRLLLERHLNVSEVALRVGYQNPSKFAAAFRRHFGTSPSSL